jgi:peptide/nickel transport system substrate-binding protein
VRRGLLSLALCLLLAACGPYPSRTAVVGPSPAATPWPTAVFVPPRATPGPSPTPPIPTPYPGRTLTVCMNSEPDTLYIYGGSTLAASHVQAAIYGGPIDTVSYAYQPVILEKLPSLADGDAAIRAVTVGPGDLVSEPAGWGVELTEHPSPTIRLRPAGCRTWACEVDYVSGTIELDRLVVTFTLRAGLTWADGTPVTAYDSEYSFDLYMDPDTPCPYGEHWLPDAASYSAVDDRTVVWTGVPGYLYRDYQTRFWQPLPQHQMGPRTAADVCDSEEASRTPMGYGPYTTREWVAGDHITVVRNPFYHRASEGLPYFDYVVYRFIPDDVEAAVAALLAGQCDVLTQDFSFDQEMASLLELDHQGRLRLHTTPGTVLES